MLHAAANPLRARADSSERLIRFAQGCAAPVSTQQ
jgi:hypothetical protein